MKGKTDNSNGELDGGKDWVLDEATPRFVLADARWKSEVVTCPNCKAKSCGGPHTENRFGAIWLCRCCDEAVLLLLSR